MGRQSAAAARSNTRIIQVGISTSPICGVRDCATVLERAFADARIDAPLVWCDLDRRRSAWDHYRDVGHWLARVRNEAGRLQVDAALLHYSAFAFGPRGLPLFVPRTARGLGATAVPMIGFFHELAYPLGRRGWRGGVQAASQHIAVLPLVRLCDAAIVTTEQRRTWLETRWWLPRKSVLFVPVPSNLPEASDFAKTREDALIVGVVGFGSPGASVSVVAGAVCQLRDRGQDVRLVLLGAPGREGSAGCRWQQEVEARGHGAILEFSGVQDAQRLAAELARADLIVFPDASGPDSRRGTLAAALAAGKVVLALDGPETWERLVTEQAVVIVPSDSGALADDLARFAEDTPLSARQGARARGFYDRVMAPDVVAAKIGALIESAVSTSRQRALVAS